jgi:hypothetical protein
MATELLTRDAFREGVFDRDGHSCVICGARAADAHHIIERRLFEDGGYYLDNGASVCERHHIEAEQTVLSCEALREAIKIRRIVLPSHLYPDQRYDKWGNPILSNGTRLRGELFEDESVQKVLKPVIGSFTNRVKYPRTFHLPWSPGVSNDDRIMPSLDSFVGKEVVAMVKLDGENTTMYRDGIHARSLEHEPHPSRDRVRALHGSIAHELPENWRFCGENLYAKHSIHYHHLPDYFLLFAVWDPSNVCIPWDDTVEWAELIGVKTVPVIWRGIWDEKAMRELHQPIRDGDECEGFVVRLAGSFHYKAFRTSVGKYVRKGHIASHGHWMRQRVIPNSIKG